MDDPVMKAMAEMASEKEQQAPDLIATGLVKSYGDRTVVNGMSMNVRCGEIVGLLGPNGAGKTTTFYMIVGLVHRIFTSLKTNISSGTNALLSSRFVCEILTDRKSVV